MSFVTEVAGHVLLPHQADWSRPPSYDRLWRSDVVAALGGAEDRSSTRAEAWIKLAYQLQPADHVERSQAEVRLRSALKAGKMCVPFFGRGVDLASAASAGATSVVLARTAHGVVAGNYVFLQPAKATLYATWDAVLVDSVAGATLTLATPLANAYEAGDYCWRLLFGRPTPPDVSFRTSRHSTIDVELLFDARDVSASAYDDFDSYALGEASSLDGGYGWAGPWVFMEMAA